MPTDFWKWALASGHRAKHNDGMSTARFAYFWYYFFSPPGRGAAGGT